MEDREIFDLILEAKKSFGIKCPKFAGALTVEEIRRTLENHGINVSPRDIFIKGLPIEIDLLIPKKGAIPKHGLLYEPQDVLVVLEIKNYGSFGEATINGIKRNFERICKANEEIYCAYVTLQERKGYKWAISRENIGFPAYTLFWHYGSGAKYEIESTGDWERLLGDIDKITQSDRNAKVA